MFVLPCTSTSSTFCIRIKILNRILNTLTIQIYKPYLNYKTIRCSKNKFEKLTLSPPVA